MKKLFALVLVSILVGCASEAIPMYPDAPSSDDRVLVIVDATDSQPDASGEDASSEATVDAQPDASAEDATPEAATDAADVTDAGPALTVIFDGPPARTIYGGQQDVPFFRFSLIAHRKVEISQLMFRIVGVNADDAVRGSRGTDYFDDVKVKDMDRGTTVTGPTSLPSDLAFGATDTGLITHREWFGMLAGTTRHLALTVDTSNTEDAPGELFSGTHAYRVIVEDGFGHFLGASAVHDPDSGALIPPEQIENDVSITGNPQTFATPGALTVALAASPVSTTVVRNATNVASVGLVFTAASRDVLVTSVTLSGAGDTHGEFLHANLSEVVTSCALYDGATQVGIAAVPDMATGRMTISSMNAPVPAGTSRTLVARCTVDSTIAQEGGDRYAIGIAAPFEVQALDPDANPVSASLASAVVANSSSTPLDVIITVRHSGTLTIERGVMRQSTILVAGGDVWHNVAEFRATARYEDARIDRVGLHAVGDSANFAYVAIAHGYSVFGTGIFPAGINEQTNVELAPRPIVVAADSSVTFQVWVQLNNVQFSATVSGATDGVCLSGNIFAVALNGTPGGHYEVDARGTTSGEPLYAPSEGSLAGNPFVIRRSVPIVTRQALSTTTLFSGSDQDLYKLRVSANGPGVGLKKFTLHYNIARVSGSSLSLRNFRLRRGSTEVPLIDYTIMDQAGRDLRMASLGSVVTSGDLIVVFTSEETIFGSVNDYTLHATTEGTVVSGDAIVLSFARTSRRPMGYRDVTGYLVMNPGYASPNLDLSPWCSSLTCAGAGPFQVADFLWSDESEVPHSANLGAMGGSRDWTDDVYIDDLTQTQVLSR